MIYYYAFLALVMLFASLDNRYPKSKLWLGMVLATMVLFAGLRDSAVGTDAMGYARSFEIGRTEIEGDLWTLLRKEPGFYYLNLFLATISTQYVALFTGIALLTYSCVVTSIKRETDSLVIPLFVYITLGLYTFVFNAARQGIAVGIYMLSFKYLYEDQKIKPFLKYSLIVLIAAMFHKTVIIALPLYFLFKQKYSAKMLLLVGALGIAIGAYLPALLEAASEEEQRYSLYSQLAGGGEMLTLFYILITAFFILWRSNVDRRFLRRYDIFLNMMLFGTLIYIVVQLSGVYIEMTRFAAYFQVAACFLWAFIYKSAKRPRDLFSFAIIMGHLIYFYIFCTRMANLIPYIFNQTL